MALRRVLGIWVAVIGIARFAGAADVVWIEGETPATINVKADINASAKP